jgi:PAS domain S-box-containing protein
MEMTLAAKRAKSGTRGRKFHSTGTKARASRPRRSRADLEHELKACRREITRARQRLVEATKQQTATSGMLRLISNSPIQSVLDAVAEHAARLCDASNARIWRLEDNLLRLAASYGESSATMDAREGLPVDRDTVTGRAAHDRRTIHVHDIAAEDSEYPVVSRLVKDLGWRTTLATPLLREATSIGTILVRRMEVRPFSDKQISLLETFAAQAAIAIENVRLFGAEKQRALALAHANRDLAEREAKIRRLVDSNIIGIFIWDFDGRILDANDAFLRMVNYDREDLVSGRIRWAELTPPDWRDRNNSRIATHKGSGHFPPYEKEYSRKDGTRVPVLMGGATFEGSNQGMAYVLDLTERKRAEDVLREREAQLAEARRELRQLIDTIQTPVASYSADNRRDFVNAAWKQYTGLSDEAALGTEWSVVTHSDHIATGEKTWRDALATGKPWHTEERVRRADGQYRWFAIDRVAARDENGKVIKWYATGYDIDERKRAEERLRVQHTVAQILAEAATIEEAAPRILRAIGECLGWDVGVLWRVDREGQALRCVELWHTASIEIPEFESVSREFTFAPGLGLPGRVWSSLKPEYIPDVVPDENFPRGSIAEREGLHAAFGFPILLGGELVGVIEFFSREIRQPDQELLNMLGTIGSQIGQFIERKRAEAELRESEQNYRMLFESIDQGFCTIEVLFDQNEKPVDYRFLQISPSFERQTGIKNAAGRRMREIAPQHEEHWFEIYGRIALTGGPMRFENEAKQLGRWYDVYAFRVEEPNRRRVGILFNDITERKRAEEALRESAEALRRSEAYLAEAQRLSHTGTFCVTAGPGARTVVYWSEENYRIWGFDPRQGLPNPEAVWQRIHPDDRDRVTEETQEAMRRKSDYVVDFRIVLLDGTIKYLESIGHYLFSSGGDLVEIVGTHVDVTERKRAMEEHERLRQLEADLAHMNRLGMMGELAASLAHEITQPIASARNNARAALNFLDRQPSDLGEVSEALGCVVGDADRAGDIVDRIREHIKKAPPRKERFDLNTATNEVIVLARSTITENGISVETRLADGLLPIQGDCVQVQQVILNLVLNAVEAMGSVETSARELVITTEQIKSGGVLVAVRDSGPGIDPEHRERVFEAFYTTKSNGTGMGLSICRSIIDAHGGRLWAEANEPRGAVFQFTLPGAER